MSRLLKARNHMKRKNSAAFAKRNARLAVLVAGAGCSMFSSGLQGQEALRQSLMEEQSALTRRRGEEDQHYNLKIGRLGVNFDAGLEAEYNDNVNVSAHNRQTDVTLRPQLSLRSRWQVTQFNALSLHVGLAYSAYIDHPRYNRFLITPDSEVSFDIFLKDYRLNFHDRISYVQNAIEAGTVSGDAASAQHTALFGGLSNNAGVEIGRNLGRFGYSVGYDHSVFQASSSYWERLDKNSELFFGRGRVALNEAFALGPEATGELNSYDKHILNDSTSYTMGAFVDWKISSKLMATARAGYVSYKFGTTGSLGPTKDVSSLYGSLTIEHVINQYLSHAIVGNRENRLGVYADSLSVYSLHYDLKLAIIRDVPLAARVIYEQARDNRLSGPETYDRVGFYLDADYKLTRKTTVKLGYRYFTKDSSVVDRTYDQNSVTLTLLYRF